MTTIQVEIDELGNVKTKVEGWPGKNCSDVSKFLSEALGAVTNSQPTHEFYLQEKQNQYAKVQS